MTTFEYKGINKVTKTLASGEEKIFYYHRSTGKRLPGLPGSAVFHAAYMEAEGNTSHDTGTVKELITAYQKSPQWVGKKTASRSKKRGIKLLGEGTKREYRRMIGYLEEEFGSMSIAALGAKSAIGVFITYQEEVAMESPREADNRLTVMSAVLSYSYRKGKIARNPLLGFERMYASDRADIIWLELDIEKFMDGAPVEMQRALILAIHTGQRYGDLVRLRWADYDGEYIALRQNKTGAKVKVKVTAALKGMLEATPKRGPYILTRPDGRPWFTSKNDKAMGKAWRERMDDAALRSEGYLAEARADPELKGVRLHFNDLRGTAVTLLAASGCTVPEIASITGHSLETANQILKKYLARSQAISDAAMFKFENSKATGFANRLQTKVAANS
jgi:integrase